MDRVSQDFQHQIDLQSCRFLHRCVYLESLAHQPLEILFDEDLQVQPKQFQLSYLNLFSLYVSQVIHQEISQLLLLNLYVARKRHALSRQK